MKEEVSVWFRPSTLIADETYSILTNLSTVAGWLHGLFSGGFRRVPVFPPFPFSPVLALHVVSREVVA